jgi:hypothetical protein
VRPQHDKPCSSAPATPNRLCLFFIFQRRQWCELTNHPYILFREGTERNSCYANFNPNDCIRDIPCLANPMRAIFSLQKTRTRALTTQQEHAAQAHLTAHHTSNDECSIRPVFIQYSGRVTCLLIIVGVEVNVVQDNDVGCCQVDPHAACRQRLLSYRRRDLLQPTSVFLAIDENHMWISFLYVARFPLQLFTNKISTVLSPLLILLRDLAMYFNGQQKQTRRRGSQSESAYPPWLTVGKRTHHRSLGMRR